VEWLNSLSWTLISFVFVLGIMIFVHELGHFLVAQWLGIRVEVFSLGFGPRLFGFRRDETEYRVSAVPLGGYVKMKGEQYEESLSGSADEFLSRPKKDRFLVAVAGPTMNLLLAVVLLAGVYATGLEVPSFLFEPPVVGYVAPESPAEEVELRAGDLILSVDGRPVETWEELQLVVVGLSDETVRVRFRREDQEFERLVRLRELPETGAGYLGVYPSTWILVNDVEAGSPAAKAGLQKGDVILAADDGETRAEYYTEVLDLIGRSEGVPLRLTVRRGSRVFEAEIVPRGDGERARVGITVAPSTGMDTRRVSFGPVEALQRSVKRNYELTVLTLRIVGRLITGRTSLKMMSGPIEIARFSGQAAAQGFVTLIGFMALISLQLGIFNLLPIPVLDGGVIAVLLVEAILGRDLSLEARERITQAGFLFLLVLMGLVILNDIAKLL